MIADNPNLPKIFPPSKTSQSKLRDDFAGFIGSVAFGVIIVGL